jgi:glutathione S-transferase
MAESQIELVWFAGSCARVTLIALEEIGVPFTETIAIVTHLSKTHLEARLLPAGDALVDVDVLATMSWFASGMHPLVAALRLPMLVNDDPASFARTRAIAAQGLARCFTILEQRLSDREWLYGAWSIVDVYLLWLWFRAVGSGMDGSDFPRCADHAQRCEQRSTVARVLEREESAYAGLLASGTLTETLPPHQVGLAPIQAKSAGAPEDHAVAGRGSEPD